MGVTIQADFSDIEAMVERLGAGQPDVMSDAAAQLAAIAKDRAPVRSGSLVESIETDSGPNRLTVRATARYASFVDPFMPTEDEAAELVAELYDAGLAG